MVEDGEGAWWLVYHSWRYGHLLRYRVALTIAEILSRLSLLLCYKVIAKGKKCPIDFGHFVQKPLRMFLELCLYDIRKALIPANERTVSGKF